MSAVTFCPVPLYEFSENLPANRCKVHKCSLLLWQAWHFFNSRQGNASSGVYNFNGVLRSSFEFLIGFRTLFEFRLRDGTLRYGHTESNLRTSLRSYVYSVYYRTGRCRIKAVPNDQCGSVRKVLSVRRRRPRFARPPIGFGSSLGFRT